MLVLFSLEDARDVVIIVYGVLGIIFFFIAIIVAAVLFFSVKGVISTAREIMRDSIKPALDSVRDTAKNIQGTTEFVSQSAVKPIFRVYGIFAGVRKGAGVLAGLRGRKQG